MALNIILLIRRFASFNIETATKQAGYPIVSHQTITEDGYKLTLHRLGNQKNQRKVLEHGTPILIQHGMWSSSENWIVQGPKHSLGYILSSCGYDVWLGNTRGNIHSREHTQISIDNPKFWNFSWHQMGMFDLPAMIDTIIKETGRNQLYYIGHSQGSTICFVMLSQKPEYNQKIRAMIALAPVAFLKNINHKILQSASILSDPILKSLQALGIYKLYPNDKLSSFVENVWSANPYLPNHIAHFMLSGLSSYANDNVKKNVQKVIMSHIKCGTSSLCLAHFGQCVRSGDFKQFDYGFEMNQKVYGSENPPKYDLTKIQSPVVIFYSEGDYFTHKKDIENLNSKLGSQVKPVECLKDSNFHHQDFVWADLSKFDIIYKLLGYLILFGGIKD